MDPQVKTFLTLSMTLAMAVGIGRADDSDTRRVQAAQSFRAKGELVLAAPDGTLFCEAEEFKIVKPATAASSDVPSTGWKAGYWGQNYFAATMANTFLSRKAFLGAPEQCEDTVASISIKVPEAGRYLALARFEAAYRFETQFKIKIEQGGKTKLDRLYGARKNLKIWAFGKKLATEVEWDWGAVENVVWEGHDAFVDLDAGPATITLTAGQQPAPGAKRNVDLIMLTKDVAQVNERIDKEGYLPLDGWLTQAGDVWMKISNNDSKAVSLNSMGFPGGPMQQHSPYWVHQRNWKPISVSVEPGKTTDWIDVGGTMDTLNDGQWGFSSSGPCKLEFGAQNAAGKIESIRTLDCNGTLPLISYADVRYLRSVVTTAEANKDIFDYIKNLPAHGKPIEKTVIYAFGALDPSFYSLYSLNIINNNNKVEKKDAYIDLRSKGPVDLEAACLKFSEAERKNVFVVSLGDEIALQQPGAAAGDFVTYLQTHGVKADEVAPGAGGKWDAVAYSKDPGSQTTNPALFYWSQRYRHDYGIRQQKVLTDTLHKYLPNAHIGANFSPHHGGGAHTQLGEVFSWVNCFRQDGMTLPWAEDYIWQVPVGSPQMNAINLELFRAGNRGKQGRKIMYYVMPHYPGNTPAMWRRLFHNAVGHGATILNLFEFDPVWVAYSENHVTSKDMYATVHQTIRELGLYEDIVQEGQVHPAKAALWFSETGDIWENNNYSFGAAKRGLYVAILGQQHLLDFVVDADAADGTLNKYETLYLTDNNVSRESSVKIAAWVRAGGSLFATAGAGMNDEYNQPNKVLRELLGVEQAKIEIPEGAQTSFIKQDLNFVKPVDSVTLNEEATLPAFGVVSRVKAAEGTQVLGKFKDGSPAVVANQPGKGHTLYCGFLPSLSYFKPAIPLMPLDRGSTDDAMAHFIPTNFDAQAGALIATATASLKKPVVSSVPLVECSIIEAKSGTAILVQNWSGKPAPGIELTMNIPIPMASANLASGGKLTKSKEGETVKFVFDLDVADTLILR